MSDTGGVPLGPEPEPTGTGGTGGPGGWGDEPRTEPFAVAALVWSIVSLALPIIGTVVAFVLATRAADAIRRAGGDRKGEQYVYTSRVIAGAGLAAWAIGLVLVLALRGGDSTDGNHVAVPTQPPSTTVPAPTTTVTTRPLVTTTTRRPVTTTRPPPTISVVPPPSTAAPTTAPPTTAAPTTAAPTTAAPTTAAPTTAAPTTAAPTTAAPTTTHAPTTTTSPEHKIEADLERRLLHRKGLGKSNRGVPDAERFVVTYSPGHELLVTWAIDDGVAPLPTGSATCGAPPSSSSSSIPASSSTSTTTTSSSTTTTTTVTSTTKPLVTTTTTPDPTTLSTSARARFEARQVLIVLRARLGQLNITGVELQGTFPIVEDQDVDVDVVKVHYPRSAVQSPFSDYTRAFDVPPAAQLECLNPAFEN